MKKHYYYILLVLWALYPFSTALSQESTEWESKLKDCVVQLPIKGTSKHDAADHKLAMKFENVELVWLHLEKSMKKDTSLSPMRVYLVSETMKNGSTVEYIIPVEDFKAGIHAPIFPEWKSKKNKFYKADCFDSIYHR